MKNQHVDKHINIGTVCFSCDSVHTTSRGMPRLLKYPEFIIQLRRHLNDFLHSCTETHEALVTYFILYFIPTASLTRRRSFFGKAVFPDWSTSLHFFLYHSLFEALFYLLSFFVDVMKHTSSKGEYMQYDEATCIYSTANLRSRSNDDTTLIFFASSPLHISNTFTTTSLLHFQATHLKL